MPNRRAGGGWQASLAAGDAMPLAPIKEFAAKPYTAEEEISLSEIIKSFNDRHGT
jgi:type I restriction enzyme R subunit